MKRDVIDIFAQSRVILKETSVVLVTGIKHWLLLGIKHI
jgi:hypothetical protein